MICYYMILYHVIFYYIVIIMWSALMGSLPMSWLLTETFRALPSAYFCLPECARGCFSPQSVKTHSFSSGPISVVPICPRPRRASRSCRARASCCSPTGAKNNIIVAIFYPFSHIHVYIYTYRYIYIYIYICIHIHEPANTAKHSPKSISEGGRIWQI